MSVGIMASSVLGKGAKAQLGSAVATASGTTLVITTTADILIDDLVVVRVASDNLSATTPTFTCADSSGNAYTTHVQAAVNATAAAGVAGGLMASRATANVPAGGTITVTLSGAVAARAAFAESFSGFTNTVRVAPVSATGVSTAAAAPTTGTIVAGDLVLGTIAWETRAALTGDADTGGGTWAPMVSRANAASGSDATCVTVGGQHKVPSNTGGQLFNVSTVSAEWAIMTVVLQAAP